MHGLIFATWEKFLGEQYGDVVLGIYKAAVQGTEASIPLVTRAYDDAVLLRGVAAVAQLPGFDASVLLREYGKYFITSGLTSHICKHILTNIHSARELLLAMRGVHKQLNYASSEITPPLFSYMPLQGDDLRISYDSHRHLCPILFGAIEGAGALYHEVIALQELSCMSMGDAECQFNVFFLGKNGEDSADTIEYHAVKRNKTADLIFRMLPTSGRGLTLNEVSILAEARYHHKIRPSEIAGLIMQMQNVGMVILSAKKTGDMFYEREYLRVSKFETEAGRLLVVNVS